MLSRFKWLLIGKQQQLNAFDVEHPDFWKEQWIHQNRVIAQQAKGLQRQAARIKKLRKQIEDYTDAK